jgi:2-amino-4-hydroxy-6-hydroxymethyldihydropteridine diphosphokinase
LTLSPNPYLIDADTLTGDMRPIRRAVVAIGSNLGDRLGNLQGAIDALSDTPEVWLTGVSSIYETAPVGCPPGSENFLNAVVLLDTTLPARRLMDRGHAIEEAYGRLRLGENTPRTLDVDLIVVGDRRSSDEHLTLPHPRARERGFVLAPWHELEPDAILVDAGPIGELLEEMDLTQVRRRDDIGLDLPL